MNSAQAELDGAGEADDIRPIVATGANRDWTVWVFLALVLIGGIALFNAMSSSRQAAQAPSTLVPDGQPEGRISSPPPLALPLARPDLPPVMLRNDPIAPVRPFTPLPAPAVTTPPVARPAPALAPAPREPLRQPRSSAPLNLPDPPLPPPVPTVVYQSQGQSTGAGQAGSQADGTGERVEAGRFENPAFTVPQGTVIPAVLETALDSTRPGAVRALVQRDVRGFDGSRILIHRGSRLYGEYEADLVTGQNRALVRWTRLIRPDGVTIALDSPASDPLGRAGVKGKVDGKFFQRFGSALLQSVLDIGVGIAVQEASDGVVVALPGSTQNITNQQPQRIQPTLKVKHGASLSVFVARDLDFSTVDR